MTKTEQGQRFKKATPRPWQIHKFISAWDDSDLLVVNAVGASPVGRNQKSCVESTDGLNVLDVYGATDAEALSNAALAVEAVNSYDARTQLLQTSLDLLNDVYNSRASQRFSAIGLSRIKSHIAELQSALNPKN